jgi:hypothetical protein
MTTSSHDQPALVAPGVKAQHQWKPDDPLEPPEQTLLHHALAGKQLDLVGNGGVDDEAMNEWGADRAVRAAVLRHLLVESRWAVHSKGVRLRGARISGQLDLESATLRCPLLLEDCYLDSPDPIVLNHATASRIVLSRCRVVGGLTAVLLVAKQLGLDGSKFEGAIRLLDAEIAGQLSCRGGQLTGTDNGGNALIGDNLKVGGGAFFQRFTAAGAIRLLDADINGQLVCRGAQLTGTDSDGDALVGDRMKVRGGAFFDQGFTASGAIRLSDVDIIGQLNFGGAKLNGADSVGNALVGDWITVSAGAFFNNVFTAAGAIRLVEADITGQLNCRGARLNGTDRDRISIVGDAMKVGGALILDDVTAAGAIRLVEADITGQLNCRGAQLNGTDGEGNTLVSEAMKVGASVFFDHGFTAAGAVSVATARIGGSLFINGAELATSVAVAKPAALYAGGLHVGDQLRWAPLSPVRGLVDLERAAVHRLDDYWSLPDAHWPPAGQLRLAGFTYDGFGGQHQASWRQRLDWIRRSHTTASGTTPAAFAAQPYEQLARVYWQAGQEQEARKVAIARRSDLRRYGSLTRPQKLGNWLLDKTIRHGYQPLRAVVWLGLVYLAVLGVFLYAQHQDSVIVPAKDTKTIQLAPTALHCSPGYPCFYPAGYAVDVVVPIVKLRQAENWRPNGHAPWGWVYFAVGWAATGLGWALTTLAIAGYTGLVRKD